MAELIPISIIIADRSYRIKVEAHDEETVRKTVKVINDKIMEFKVNLAGKDMQDYVSMVLIWYATQPAQTIGNQIKDADIAESLTRLENMIDKGLAVESR